jgi:hypothetical protein
MSLMIINDLTREYLLSDGIMRKINTNIKKIEERRGRPYRTKTQLKARDELIKNLSGVRKNLEKTVPETQLLETMKLVISIKEIIDTYFQNRTEGRERRKNWRNSVNFETTLEHIYHYNSMLAKVCLGISEQKENLLGNAALEVMKNQLNEIKEIAKTQELQYRMNRFHNPGAQPPPSLYGGSLFVNVKGVGKRKVRYYKNGNKYVLAKGKKKKI